MSPVEPLLVDDELELRIKQYGDEFLTAHAAGNITAARGWLAAEIEAVNARSPAQVARMERCYFSEQGRIARMRSQTA